MRLRSLRLHSFRAHAESALTFSPKVNLLHGPNGAGKTNVLEAVHYLCLGKSFLAAQDGVVVRRGAPFFEVEGRFEGERRADLAVRMVYVPEEGKRLFVNKAPLDRLADVVGTFPVVVLSPEDGALTAGGPEERRRFLDTTLSQARPPTSPTSSGTAGPSSSGTPSSSPAAEPRSIPPPSRPGPRSSPRSAPV
jgi:DNA replication and repair protein RecF